MQKSYPFTPNPTNERILDVDLTSGIPDGNLLIFVGVNNSKKSTLLKELARQGSGEYISPSRLDMNTAGSIPADLEKDLGSKRLKAGKQFYHNNHHPISEFPISDTYLEIIHLDNIDREELVNFHNEHFDELEITRSNPKSDYSSPKILLNGIEASTAGTGSRSILSLLCRLFDSKLEFLVIDEPEIGLEPRKQKVLFDLIKSKSESKKIYLATHSNIFLDKTNKDNNWIVSSTESQIEIDQIGSDEVLMQTSFNLLGASPTDLMLPQNIIIVEGRSDAIFLEKVMTLEFPQNSVSIHFAEGITKIDVGIPAIDQMLKSLSYLSLYKDKICVLIDGDGVQTNVIENWRTYLEDTTGRILQLSENGIEYYYPAEILNELAGVEISGEDILAFNFESKSSNSKKGTLGDFRGSKVELAEAVSGRLTSTEDIDPQILGLLKLCINNSFEI